MTYQPSNNPYEHLNQMNKKKDEDLQNAISSLSTFSEGGAPADSTDVALTEIPENVELNPAQALSGSGTSTFPDDIQGQTLWDGSPEVISPDGYSEDPTYGNTEGLPPITDAEIVHDNSNPLNAEDVNNLEVVNGEPVSNLINNNPGNSYGESVDDSGFSSTEDGTVLDDFGNPVSDEDMFGVDGVDYNQPPEEHYSVIPGMPGYENYVAMQNAKYGQTYGATTEPPPPITSESATVEGVSEPFTIDTTTSSGGDVPTENNPGFNFMTGNPNLTFQERLDQAKTFNDITSGNDYSSGISLSNNPNFSYENIINNQNKTKDNPFGVQFDPQLNTNTVDGQAHSFGDNYEYVDGKFQPKPIKSIQEQYLENNPINVDLADVPEFTPGQMQRSNLELPKGFNRKRLYTGPNGEIMHKRFGRPDEDVTQQLDDWNKGTDLGKYESLEDGKVVHDTMQEILDTPQDQQEIDQAQFEQLTPEQQKQYIQDRKAEGIVDYMKDDPGTEMEYVDGQWVEKGSITSDKNEPITSDSDAGNLEITSDSDGPELVTEGDGDGGAVIDDEEVESINTDLAEVTDNPETNEITSAISTDLNDDTSDSKLVVEETKDVVDALSDGGTPTKEPKTKVGKWLKDKWEWAKEYQKTPEGQAYFGNIAKIFSSFYEDQTGKEQGSSWQGKAADFAVERGKQRSGTKLVNDTNANVKNNLSPDQNAPPRDVNLTTYAGSNLEELNLLLDQNVLNKAEYDILVSKLTGGSE